MYEESRGPKESEKQIQQTVREAYALHRGKLTEIGASGFAHSLKVGRDEEQRI